MDATHDTFHTSFNPILHLLVDMYLLLYMSSKLTYLLDMYLLSTHFSEKHCRLQTWRHKIL